MTPTCLVCGREIELGDFDVPYPAVRFHTTGNYGSTVYDPGPEFTGSDDRLEALVCDWCMVKHRNRFKVFGPHGIPEQVPKHLRD